MRATIDTFPAVSNNTSKKAVPSRVRADTRIPPSLFHEDRRSTVTLGNKPVLSYAEGGRSDVSLGQRVFHEKFGYGEIVEIEGNKLEIDFEHAGRNRVMDSFVKVG